MSNGDLGRLKIITSNVPCLVLILLLSPASQVKHDSKWCRISPGLVGVSCPDFAPLSFLRSTPLLAGGTG